jgi:DNA-binding transcriptional LysR family regulator
MNGNLQWDDLRIVLAIADEGSLSGAGRRLGVSHATVFRRLGDLERRLAVRLFDRDRGGYRPTVAGEATAAAARRVETEVLAVERLLAGQDLRPSGRLRVTTTDSLLAGVLAPVFAEFRRDFPEIDLEVALSNQLFSLSRREADIALRPSTAPPEVLVGRRIATIAQAAYGHAGLVDAADPLALQEADWIGPDDAMAYRALERWMAAEGHDRRCRYRLDSVLGMAAAAGEGAGLAVLPCYLGDADGRLVRLGEPLRSLATDLWLLTHPDLRHAARVRAFLDFVAAGGGPTEGTAVRSGLKPVTGSECPGSIQSWRLFSQSDEIVLAPDGPFG